MVGTPAGRRGRAIPGLRNGPVPTCLRPALGARGKSGGARVIYYHDNRLPLFLLTCYGKGRKADLTAAERNRMRGLGKVLADTYGRKGHARSRR